MRDTRSPAHPNHGTAADPLAGSPPDTVSPYFRRDHLERLRGVPERYRHRPLRHLHGVVPARRTAVADPDQRRRRERGHADRLLRGHLRPAADRRHDPGADHLWLSTTSQWPCAGRVAHKLLLRHPRFAEHRQPVRHGLVVEGDEHGDVGPVVADDVARERFLCRVRSIVHEVLDPHPVDSETVAELSVAVFEGTGVLRSPQRAAHEMIRFLLEAVIARTAAEAAPRTDRVTAPKRSFRWCDRTCSRGGLRLPHAAGGWTRPGCAAVPLPRLPRGAGGRPA